MNELEDFLFNLIQPGLSANELTDTEFDGLNKVNVSNDSLISILIRFAISFCFNFWWENLTFVEEKQWAKTYWSRIGYHIFVVVAEYLAFA